MPVSWTVTALASVREASRMIDRKRSASGSCSRTAMKTELSTTIIRSSPRLFKDVARHPRIEQRPGGNTPRYVARAFDIDGLARSRVLGNGDTGNPRFHLDACFHDVLNRLAAPRGDAARELFGFRRQDDCQKILRENASAIPPSRYICSGPGKQQSRLKRNTCSNALGEFVLCPPPKNSIATGWLTGLGNASYSV
jgi:hypothetical protein